MIKRGRDSKLSSSILKRLWKLRKTPVVAYRRGAWWLLNPRDFIDNRLLGHAVFEDEQVKRARHYIAAHRLRLVFDIGANFGMYSVILGRMPEIEEVIAFEPVNRNYAQFMANVYLNHLTEKVVVHKLALSDAAGQSVIHLYPGSAGMARLDKETAHDKQEHFKQQQPIELRRFDDLYAFRDRRFFAKVDVEGHAPQVLSGMEQFLRANQGVLQIECLGDEEPRVEAFMKTLGYHYLDKVLHDRYYTNLDD